MRRLDEVLERQRAAITARTTTSYAAPRRPADDEEDVCPRCEGARFVRVTADPTDPNFGRAVPCDCAVHEDDVSRRDRLLRYSRLGALERFTFATLLPRGRSTDAQTQARYAEAVSAARLFANEPRGWLVLSGPPGSGKTHIAAAIANDAIDHGRPALFLSVADLLDTLRGSYDDDAELSYEGLSEQLRSAPLVVLDDLDSYAATPWAEEKLMQILSHRFHAALSTVFTCRRAPEELDERLATRLADPAISQVFVLERPRMERYFHVGAMSEDRLAEYTFENFRPHGHGLQGNAMRNLEAAYRLALGWAQSPAGWLVLLGSTGCGKTHLAAAVANVVLASGKTVAFADVADLVDAMYEELDGERKNRNLLRRLQDADLLILDGLGPDRTTRPWTREKLYQLVANRHLRRLPTVVTSDRELGELDTRIASRLNDLKVGGTVFDIEAPDYRIGA